jgi:UDP-3-O-[3-hydroxymyristoyl] N-acetylglucosamine deacetylase
MRTSVAVAGRTLSGRRSRLAIARSRDLTINLRNGSRRPRTIKLALNNITVENHLVHLGRKPRIRVVEHLFSALCGLNLFRCRIDLNCYELPFFDGSSRTLARALDKLARSRPAAIRGRAAEVHCGRSFLTYRPEPRDKLLVDMTLRHSFIGVQRIKLAITPASYKREIAPARTFVFTDVRDNRLKKLPPYGFAVTKQGVFSTSPLRFPDEAVRHKVLDLLGDLFVLGGRLVGTITGYNTSHELNYSLAEKLLNDRRWP